MNTINDLKTKGFFDLQYPSSLRAKVSQVAMAWKEFYMLPTDIKKGLPYSNTADGVGYELKDGLGDKADRKENFDVTTAGKTWLETEIKNIHNQKALEFVKEATALVGLLKPTILDFARQAEQVFGLEGFVDEVNASEDSYFVRFIHYFGELN